MEDTAFRMGSDSLISNMGSGWGNGSAAMKITTRDNHFRAIICRYMKSKSFFLAGRIFLICALLYQSGLAVNIVKAQVVSTSAQNISLVTGWNLISFNLLPTSNAITDVLSSIAGNYNMVYAWDATGAHSSSGNWMRYAPGIPGNTLSTLDVNQGFWIRMTADDILVITGTPPTISYISLSTSAGGWNLVGYPSALNRSLPDAFSAHGVPSADFSSVYAYHANDSDTWKRYAQGIPGNDLLELAPGWGYWVKVTSAHSWDVDYSNSKPPLSKFGVALARSADPFADYSSNGIGSSRIGWFINYNVSANPTAHPGVEYLPTVRVKQLKRAADGTKVTCRLGDYYVSPPEYVISPGISEIQAIASNHPGMTWLVGNEIERRDWVDGGCYGQDEILPELYALAYHEIYTAIKTADPTAKLANGSLVEFTNLRSQYLDRVWAEYSRLANLNGWPEKTMPVDVWNMHFFALQEVKGSWGAEIPAGLTATSGQQYTFPDDNWDFTKLWTQVVALRTWMKNHGQKEKPLITSEYGVNYPYSYYSCYDSPDKTACSVQLRDRMMYPSFNAFLNQTDSNIGYSIDGNRLVQRWAWWSADGDDGICDTGVYVETYGGALFNSGLGPANPPKDCPFPAKGITLLGTYWNQYVQGLP